MTSCTNCDLWLQCCVLLNMNKMYIWDNAGTIVNGKNKYLDKDLSQCYSVRYRVIVAQMFNKLPAIHET
jgi:hypothetical protein